MAGSVLSYQLQDIGRPQPKLFMERDIPDIAFQTPIAEKFEFPERPVVGVNGAVFDVTSVSKDFSRCFLENISVTPEDAVALEKRTVLQGESKEWLNQHSRRITASNFGKVLFRVKFPSDSMLKGIFLSSISLNARAIAHGKAKETVAKTIYCRKMQKRIPHFALYDAGLTVNPLWPYLGASPDGKVYDQWRS